MAQSSHAVNIQNLEDLRKFGKELLDQGWKKFALYGELGAGKTAFVKEVSALIELNTNIQSPTYALLFEYPVGEAFLYHFDLYRLTTSEEILDLGFEEYWEADAYEFIEWPELVKDDLPNDFIHLYIEHLKNGTRKITCL